MPRILVIDDHESMREGMAVTLKKAGHEVTAVRDGPTGIAAWDKSPFDLVISDLKMDGMDGLEVVRNLRQRAPEALILMVTAHGSIEAAVTAMREGAFDFIEKPFTPDVLRARVEKALEVASSKAWAEKLEARVDAFEQDASRGRTLIGDSAPLRKLKGQIERAAPTTATVHLQGESGTGKEVVARLLHALSPRRNGPFIAVHCASIPETLLESELFGHEKGAFTGAIRRKLGRFELADGGTLFLDELGEIPPSMQVNLLRVLQERTFTRVGGEKEVRVDVRVISATHRDLRAEAVAGRFREDLMYRLLVVPLTLPPLRERPEDIPALASHFIARHGPRLNRGVTGLTPEALQALGRYAWPGNVRELENCIEQALVFAEHAQLTEADLPSHIQGQALRATLNAGALPLPSGEHPLPQILESLEKQLIEKALEDAQGVKAETARLLGIKTSALYYKLEKYGLTTRDDS